MKRLILVCIISFIITSCDDDSGERIYIIADDNPVFVQHFRNGQYPEASYDGCQDTYMRSDNPATVYGDAITIHVAIGSGYESRSLVRFDILGALPDFVTIKKAVITLYITQTESGSGDSDIHTVGVAARAYFTPASYGTPSWDDYTWNESNTLVSRAVLDYSESSYQDIEIPEKTIKAWQKDFQNNWGLILQIENESINEGIRFSSSNDTDVYKRPMLTIFYSY